MKKSIITTALLATCLLTSAQTYTNKYPQEIEKAAHKWVKKGEWKGTFDKAVPAENVNETEFCIQYNRNKQQWDAVFKWLQDTDLKSIKPGRTPIEGTTLTASVEEGDNWCTTVDMMNGKGSESHREKIDFMYVVSGTEGFALLDHETSKKCEGGRPDAVGYDYDYKRAKIFESRQGTFNIMFPCDWHIAKVKTDKESQRIKVIVIKIDYKL